MTIQKQRVLFFFQGEQPSAEAKAEARAIGMAFRDANAYRAGDFLEQCNAVAGKPPKAYADAFPAYEPPADMPAEQGDAPPAADGE